jgi:hypothetical protein
MLTSEGEPMDEVILKHISINNAKFSSLRVVWHVDYFTIPPIDFLLQGIH